MAVMTISLGFMPARIVEPSLAAYAATRNPGLPYRHFILDQHYPVEKAANRAALRRIAADHDVTVLDAGRNLGLHDGFNWALKEIAPKTDDVIIAYDLDSTPVGHGWDLALVRAILGDPLQRVVWASLMNPRSRGDITARGYTARRADGHVDLWITKTAVTNSVCAWRYGWLQDVGFLSEPNAFYGHLETAMFAKLGAKSDWAFLPQWTEDDHLRDLHDRAYVVYKWCLAHLKTTTLDFESWLAAGHFDAATGEPTAPRQLP